MIRCSLARWAIRQGDLDAAQEHLVRAVQLAPEHMMSWKLLGTTLIDKSRTAEAIDAWTRALSLAKKNGDKQAEREISVFLRRANKVIGHGQ